MRLVIPSFARFRHRLLAVAVVCAAFVIVGCGDEDVDAPIKIEVNNGTTNGAANGTNGAANGTNGAANGATTPVAPGVSKHVQTGLSLPRYTKTTGEELFTLGSEAVFAASNLGGGGQTLITTGSLTQNGQNFTYSASPNDRLRVVWTEGPPTDLFITAFDGDFSDDAEYFIYHPHVVEIRVAREGFLDLTLRSRRDNRQRVTTLAGDLVVDDVTFTLQLNDSEEFSDDINTEYLEYESDTVFTGTILGDNGFEQQVRETFHFKMTNDVTNDDHTLNSIWSVGGKTYTVADARVRYEQRGGRVNFSDYWIIQGAVFEDGVQIGQIGYELTEINLSIYVEIYGERFELFSFSE